MLTLTSDQITALGKRQLKRRIFIWAETRTSDGDPDPVGFWDDVGNISYLGRTYNGSGNIVQVASLSAVGDLTIPALSITISGIADSALRMIRDTVIEQAPIFVYIGLFDVVNKVLLEPLLPHFQGVIDDCQVTTAETGGLSQAVLTCESASRALTNLDTDTRSDASCKAREVNDGFYQWTGVQYGKPLYFGAQSGPVTSSTGSSTG
jgi:hypothetical protein